MRKNIVAGNWKMNTTVPEGVQLAKEVCQAVAEAQDLKCDVIVGVPFTHLTAVKDVIDINKVGLAAQNCANHTSGAYTGEVSAAMVASTGANYVILGHSERRGYYNKTALDALGIEVPTTWAEMWAACAKIKTTYPDSAPLVYDSEANWFITACEQNDWDYTTTDTTNHYLFNNENTQNFLTELKGYYDLGYFQTATTANVSYTSSLFTAGIETTCFCIGSSAGASYQQPSNNLFEVGIAPIPGYAKEGSGVISQGPSLVMFDQNGDNSTLSEKEVMTFQFVKELMDPSFQSSFSQASGYMPVRTSTYDLDSYAEFLADTDNIKAVAANVAKSLNAYYYTSAVFNGSATARTQVGSALVYAVQGTKTAAEALADAYKNCGGK